MKEWKRINEWKPMKKDENEEKMKTSTYEKDLKDKGMNV